MRTPLEEQSSQPAQPGQEPTRGPLAPRKGPPPGGKALARLRLFEEVRGIQKTDPFTGAPDPSLVERLRGDLPQPSLEATAPISPDSVPQFTNRALLTTTARAVLQPGDPAPVRVPATWRCIGPFSIPHGQTRGQGPGSRPSVSGRVSAMAIDPKDSRHVLIGAACGGVWESRDGGLRWDPRTDDQPTLATGALAFDPVDPSVVYCGTGEGDFYRALGVGLLRSTDGGTTWQLHATAPFVGLGFFDLVVDPNAPAHLIAATSGNLAESHDGGATWEICRTALTFDLSMSPDGDVEAAREVFAGCSDGLFRSADGGHSWNLVQLPGGPHHFVRIEVCHAPQDAGIVYVFASTGEGAHLWRRERFGGEFLPLALPNGLRSHQSWYDWCMVIAPDDPNTVYLGAVELHRGRRVNGASGTGVDAWSWEVISARTDGSSPVTSIHPDQHHLAFDPSDPSVLYVCNDGGVYRSTDRGESWESLNKGLCITEVEYIAQHPQYEAYLLAGTQDNGTLRYEGGEVWYHVADGDGGDCAVNEESPSTCYHTFYQIQVERSTTGGGWGSWELVLYRAENYQSLFYPPLEANGSVVACAGESVMISTDDGRTWGDMPFPGAAGLGSALAIPNPNQIYVGTTIGHIYRIDRRSGVWQTPVRLGMPREGFISDILVDPRRGERVWVTCSSITGGHVFRSDDGGESWLDVSSNLPSIPANAIAIDPANTDIVYVACDMGVYRSTDAGFSWTDFNRGLPNALVIDLAFHPVSRLLRAGTRSRGVWEIAVDELTIPGVAIYLRDSAVDIGWRKPSLLEGSDPFVLGRVARWYESPDIKVDPYPFRFAPDSVDFERFEDDRGIFAEGLFHSIAFGKSRVYVQAHNAGPFPAVNVSVHLYWADAGADGSAPRMPALPAGFWDTYASGELPEGSPWCAVGPPRQIAQLEAGSPQVVSFDWKAPADSSGAVWLLSLISAENDPLETRELDLASLVRYQARVGLRRVDVLPFTGVQFQGGIPAKETRAWYTHDWPAGWNVVWTVVPLTVRPLGAEPAPQIRYTVEAVRTSGDYLGYTIRVTNLTNVEVAVEGRYCVLSKVPVMNTEL